MNTSEFNPAPPRQLPLGHILAQSRIPGLDFLRALAVVLVLIDHSYSFYLGPFLLANGGLGVEIFFVLSGFLITSMLLNEIATTQHIKFGAFFQRRAARLLPIFYAYVLVGIVFLHFRHKPIPWDAVASACLYVLNYYQAFTGAPTHFLSHCWSLAVEEQFYLIWPVLLSFMVTRRFRLDISILAIILLTWIYRSTLLTLDLRPDEYLYRALDTRADHLLMGCLLATLIRRPAWQLWLERIWRWPGLMPGLTFLLFASASLHDNGQYKYMVAYAVEPVLIALLIPMVILTAGAMPSAWVGRAFNARLVVLTGQASYGVYLLHQLLMRPIRLVAEALTGNTLLSVAISIAAVVFVAHLSFKWVEDPLRQRLRPTTG